MSRLPGLRRVADAMLAGGDFEPASQRVVRLLEPEFGYEFGAILALDRMGARLLPVGLSDQGKGAEFLERDRAYVSGHALCAGWGITGWCALYGRPVHVADAQRDRRYKALRRDIRCELCVPLRAGRTILGVLNTETSRPAAYSSDDLETVRVIASMVALSAVHATAAADARAGVADGGVVQREARHRAGNSLASIRGIMGLASAHAEEGLSPVWTRLETLASAHDAMARRAWRPLTLGTILRAAAGRSRAPRIVTRGPMVRVGPRQVAALALLLRELEAPGPGDKSPRPTGAAEVRWIVHGARAERATRHLELTWRERGPAHAASGSRRRLIEGLARSELGGQVEWHDGGSRAELSIMLDDLRVAP
jgi:two-component sensor histidine kinase